MTKKYSDAQVVAAAAAFAAGDVVYDETAPAKLPEPPDSEPMVPMGIRVSTALAKRIRAAAAQAGVPYSQLIREWVEVGLTELDDDQAVPLSVLRRAIAHAAQGGHAA